MAGDTAAWAKTAGKPAPAAKSKAAPQSAAANDASSTLDQPTLSVRFGNQGDLIKITFDWSSRVGGYTATMVGGTVRVEFDQKGRVDLAGAAVLPADFGRPTATNADDGSRFVMTVPPGVNFSHYRAGSKVVVDIRNPNGRPFAKPAEVKPAPSEAPKAGAEKAEKKTVEQIQKEKVEQKKQEEEAAKAKEAKLVEARAAYADKLIKEAEEKAAREEAASKPAKVSKDTSKDTSKDAGQASKEVGKPNAAKDSASQQEVAQEKPAQTTQATPTTQANNQKSKSNPDKSKGTSLLNEGADPSSAQVPDVMAGEAPSPDAAASLTQAKSLQDKAKAGALSTAKTLTPKERALLAKNQPLDGKAESSKAVIDKKTLAKVDTNVKPKGEILMQRQVVAKGLILTFPFAEKVSMAAYSRAGRYNLVFSQPIAIASPNFGESERPYITNVSNRLVPGGSLLQMELVDGVAPSFLLDGYQWIVTMKIQPTMTEQEAIVNVIADGAGEPKASVTLEGADRLLDVPDPIAGDVLKVLPTIKPGVGLSKTQRYPEFSLLATAQGVVVEPLADRLSVGQSNDTVTITSDAGLYLSRNMVSNVRNLGNQPLTSGSQADKTIAPNKLLDFASWKQLGEHKTFSEARHELEGQVVSGNVDKNVARLTLAQFYLSNAMSAEAMALLQLIEQDDPTFFGRRDVAAAALVTLIMERRLAEAERLSGFPQLINEGEAKLWLGLLRAVQGRLADAAEAFAQAPELPDSYPIPYRLAIGKAMIQSALAGEKFDRARQMITQMAGLQGLNQNQADQIESLQAELLKITEGGEKALPVWQKLRDSPDRLTSVMADLNATLTEIETGKLPLKEGIGRLDRLRFSWRGDDNELIIQLKLGELYQANRQYREAFETWLSAIKNFPDRPLVDKVRQKMANMFGLLYGEKLADTMKPIAAAALMGDYINYLGSDKVPVEIYQEWIDRLVKIDLLNQAIVAQDALIKTRLSGVEKSEAGDRLAELYLMNRQPQQALTALNSTNLPGLPPELVERRTQRRAQATAALGEARSALAELAGDSSTRASRLRASIAWQAQDWQTATNALLVLIPARPKDSVAQPSDEDSGLLLNLAIAATLAERSDVLKNLRNDWSASMSRTANGKAFKALTGEANGTDQRTMAARLAESTSLQQIVRELGKEADGKAKAEGGKAEDKKVEAPQPPAPPSTPATSPAGSAPAADGQR